MCCLGKGYLAIFSNLYFICSRPFFYLCHFCLICPPSIKLFFCTPWECTQFFQFLLKAAGVLSSNPFSLNCKIAEQVLWSQVQTLASPKLGLVTKSCNTITGGQEYLDVDGGPGLVSLLKRWFWSRTKANSK
jgi:hypothetical protein